MRAGKPHNLGIALGFAGGLAFDGGGNLWYVDQGSASIQPAIYACKGTSSCTVAYSGFGDPVFFHFAADYSGIYVADAVDNTIDFCSSGSCVTVATRLSSDPPFGVDAFPGAKN